MVGTINLMARSSLPAGTTLTERQIELVRTFADQAVIAIENVRLLDELQARTEELGRSVQELKALGDVTQAVNVDALISNRACDHRRQGGAALGYRCRRYLRVR